VILVPNFKKDYFVELFKEQSGIEIEGVPRDTLSKSSYIFQNISFISLNFISIAVILLSGAKLVIGILNPPMPLIQDAMVYHHYSSISSLVFGILIIMFTIVMAVTLLSNLQNIQKNKVPILFLGTAFFTGGVGGALVTNFDIFGLLLLGNILLFLTFVFVSLFILTSVRKAQ